MLNFIFTSLWLGLMTAGGFYLGKWIEPDYAILFAIAGFFIAALLRIAPKAIGEVVEGVVDAVT